MLKPEEAVLTVVDVQERLLPLIHESEALVGQIVRLIRGFQILRAPILVTEQYRKGLGPTEGRIMEAITHPQTADTVPLRGAIPAASQTGAPPAPETTSPAAPPALTAASPALFDPIEKMTFSCAEHAPYLEALDRLRRRQIVLCGIESHVCVLQTALQLKERGHEVYLAADAVSSRSPRNVEIALRRMEQSGSGLQAHLADLL